MLNIKSFGAVGDGATVNTHAIQKAIDAAAAANETLLIPSGTFVTGTLNLKGVSLSLESGAVLKGSENIEDYPPQPYIHNEMGALQALLINIGYDNLTIEGSGTIDFSGKSFYDTTKKNVPAGKIPFTAEQMAECTYYIPKRPNQCLFVLNSKNVVVRGITILDAPCWTMSFNHCENVKCIGLTIDTDRNVPNDDGMHFCGCKGVIISDCNISSGDDCIALSGITDWACPCEDVVISNCIFRSCSKAIVLGYIYSHVKNVLITNCIIRESNRGLCIMCNDEGGLVENVRVSNMHIETRVRAGNWWGNGEPIFFMAVKQDFHIPENQNPHRSTTCAIRNVHVQNVTCVGENAMGVVGRGALVQNVSLQNIDYTRVPSQNLPLKGCTFDLSPGRETVEVPASCGLYLSKEADVRMDNVNTHEWTVMRSVAL